MQKNYSLSVDFLRLLAILAVILIHTTIQTIQASQHDIRTIPFTFFLNQVAIFAVPLFFLISGFVLELNHKELNYISYFKKRASRILIPYIFWSIFYVFFYPNTIPKNMSFLSLLITGKAAYQLYFIPAIIIFYLFFPLLHKYYNLLKKKWIISALILLEIIMQTYDYFYGPFSFGNTLRVSLLSFVMFPLGMIAAHHEEKIRTFTKTHLIQLCLLPCLLFIIIFSQAWYQYISMHNAQAIYSQYNPLIIPYTLSLAAVLFYAGSNLGQYTAIVLKLSKLSFFVFFVHVAIIYTFWGMLQPISLKTGMSLLPNILFSIFFFLFITTTSFLIADIIHKIPKISKITG